jgi:Brp/Blh family beta-carotene 15,15'-monooxygenase
MHAFAEAFENQPKPNLTKNRFAFYDHLLLIILIRWPHLGKKIFTALFQKNTIQAIFSFLDEKSTLTAEVKIFASLPIVPFLKACGVYGANRVTKKHGYVIGFMLVYFVLQFLNPNLAAVFGYVGLVAGLLLVGIPHGAVDHLLLKNKPSSLVRFIVQYLLIIATYFIMWQWIPLFSLILFIAYSAYHFGESEFVEMQVSLSSIVQKSYAFIIGLSILLFIIFSHLETSLSVINRINGVSSFIEGVDFYPYKNAVLAVSYFSILPLWWMSKKTCLYLMAILLLGIQMPLMLAFGLYFVGSHSLNAWGHIATKLKTTNTKLYLQSLPFNLGALLIFSVFLYLQHANAQLIQSYAATFFVFLACVSLPHIVLMHLFYKKEV